MSTDTRTRETIDRMRDAIEGAGGDPHLLDDLPTPVMLADLYEIAREAGFSVAEFVCL